MARLIYFSLLSLDGYTEDANGNFDWAAPDEEVHAFANDLARPAGAYLYGRKMYETMQVWETEPALVEHSAVTRDFAKLWQAADKVVYSRTLPSVSTARTRIEREFQHGAVRDLKAASARDLAIGGPQLAAHAINAGLVDEYQMLIVPVVVGGGKRFLPDGIRLDLELLDERRFGNGTVYLRYRASA